MGMKFNTFGGQFGLRLSIAFCVQSQATLTFVLMGPILAAAWPGTQAKSKAVGERPKRMDPVSDQLLKVLMIGKNQNFNGVLTCGSQTEIRRLTHRSRSDVAAVRAPSVQSTARYSKI